MEKKFTEKDCFIYDVQKWEKKALEEKIVAERRAGKTVVEAGCGVCLGILKGALRIGLTQSELNVFQQKLEGHQYADLSRSPYFDKKTQRLDATALLDEIFGIANAFDNPTLGNYFLQTAFNEVQTKKDVDWASDRIIFNKQYKERKRQFDSQHVDIEQILSDTLAKYPGAASRYDEVKNRMLKDWADLKFDLEFSEAKVSLVDERLQYLRNNKNKLGEITNTFSVGPTQDEHYFPLAAMVAYHEQVLRVLKAKQGGQQVENTAAPNDLKNPEFTTARQVLAMHYLFEYTKVVGIDQTEKAHFIEFLTGKNYKNIYDAVRSPLATKDGNLRKGDLRYIRPYFEKLGLREIVKMIDNELDKPDQ